jgi:hypothetical protein
MIYQLFINAPTSRGLISPPSALLQTRFYDPFDKFSETLPVGGLEELIEFAQNVPARRNNNYHLE